MSQQPNVTALSAPAGPRNDAGYVGATTAPKSFVFKPGSTFNNNGPVQQNVYTTSNSSGVDGLTLLQSTLNGTGLFPAVELPSSLVEIDCSLTSNSYALTSALNFGQNCEFAGLADQSTEAFPVIESIGGSVSGIVAYKNLFFLVISGVLIADTPSLVTFEGQISAISAATGAHFYNIPASKAVIFDINCAGGFLLPATSNPIIQLGANASLTLNITGPKTLGSGIFSLGSGATIIINVTDASGIDKTLFNTSGITINISSNQILNSGTSGPAIILSPPINNARADSTAGIVPYKLPPVAFLPDGWKVKTSLVNGTISSGNQLTNSMAVQVDGGSGENLIDPDTGLLEPNWSTLASGNLLNTDVTWEWYKPGNRWFSY